jgi:hypothetical protein
MENRLSRRVECDIELLIVPQGGTALRARASNISRHGLFIAAPCEPFAAAAVVDVEFLCGSIPADCRRRVRMLVARACGDGCGLELEVCGHDESDTLALLVTNAFSALPSAFAAYAR